MRHGGRASKRNFAEHNFLVTNVTISRKLQSGLPKKHSSFCTSVTPPTTWTTTDLGWMSSVKNHTVKLVTKLYVAKLILELQSELTILDHSLCRPVNVTIPHPRMYFVMLLSAVTLTVHNSILREQYLKLLGNWNVSFMKWKENI